MTMAAVDYFLKIDGIDGESADDKHKGEIDVMSWSYSEQQSGTSSGGGGGGAGKVSMGDFRFTMTVNKATPKLFLACASGEHIKTGVLTCRKAGKDQQEYLKITLTDILVSSYQTGGSGSSDLIPVDQISLNYAKIEFEYKEQKADGTLGAAVKAGWDLKANKKV
jgi:type VI secretion system secreted protein Hcp